MNVFPAIHYWFFTIFMQFVPLNETETNNEYFFEIQNTPYQILISVDDASFQNMDSLYWRFSSELIYEDSVEDIITASVSHTPKDKLYFSNYIFFNRCIIEEEGIARFTDKNKALLITPNRDTALKLSGAATDSEVEIGKQKIKCTKRNYTDDDVSASVYFAETFGLVKTEFAIESVEYKVLRLPKQE